jgi:CO/xanthine dehydrogenase Mo-binding subunit
MSHPQQSLEITLKVNGDPKRVHVDARTTLLDALRDRLRLPGAKNGCGPGEAMFVPSNDQHFNSLGVKGLAEFAIRGVAPAIANAIYDATGKRIRELPIAPEKLLM